MTRFSNPLLQVIDANGNIDTSATLRFEEPSTTTLKTIYSDSGFTTPTTNPQTPDAGGRFINDIFLDGLYRVRLIAGDASTIFDFDPFGEVDTGQWATWDASTSYDIPQIVLGSDDNYYRSLTDSNQGNNPTTSATNWEELILGRLYNSNVTYSAGDTVIDSDGYYYASVTNSNSGNNPSTDTSNTNWIPAAKAANIDAATLNLTNFKATEAEQEAGTETDAFVAPATQHFHDSACKAWVNFTGTGTVAIQDQYNVDSITDNGTGDYTVNFTTNFSSADLVYGGFCYLNGTALFPINQATTPPAVSAIRIRGYTGSTVADADIAGVFCVGRQ